MTESQSGDPQQEQDSLVNQARQAAVEQRRRVAEVRAREHVGAAGWAQTSTLEAMLRLGREGQVVTDTLREVVRLTTQQVRTLPLSATDEERHEQARHLHRIVESGEVQLAAAHSLNELLSAALEDVLKTPVDHVNVNGLKHIHDRLEGQVQALTTIVQAAQGQADTLERLGELAQVSAEHQQRVEAIRQVSAEAEAEALGQAGEQIVNRIAELDDAQEQQLESLNRIGEAVVQGVEDSAASPQEKAQALEQLAEAAQEKSAEIRQDS